MPRAIFIILIVLFLSGCNIDSGGNSDSGGSEKPIAADVQSISSPTPKSGLPKPTTTRYHNLTATPPLIIASPSATATNTPNQTLGPTITPTASPSPTTIRPHDVARELAQAVPPARDNARLAAAFHGLEQPAQATAIPLVTETLSPGVRQTFTVLDVVNNTYGEIEAELLAAGDHAYFWFEIEPFGIVPDSEALSAVVDAFDALYAEVKIHFGDENSPGIDGESRLHILHASPQTICGIAPGSHDGCGTAGFVSSPDLQPAVLNPKSNEREMFIMNDRQFGSDYYLGVLAHEFRHLIEFNYDVADTDWEKEGSAVLATELVGLPSGGVARANEFLASPDQQLNSWSETDKTPYYGASYLFNRYLYDRLGQGIYHEFATSPLPGFVALNDLAEQYDLGFSGESLWVDWLAALVLHGHPQSADKYAINVEGLETAALTPIDELPGGVAGDVRQYAADYYELPAATFTVEFAGSDTVPLLAGQDATGEIFWYAQRANSSNPRLTRMVDLQAVKMATLAYDVYADIENGYDYAYVSVSSDGGNTWQPLTAANMQGLDPADDPSGSALTPRFYTGRTPEWRHEIVDLTPFAGQEILLRFEMVTDAILTYSGFAVDNVAIPEIGFFDDDSSLDDWTAEGFSFVTSLLPQPWRLQLISFPSTGPVVEEIAVSSDGRAEFTVVGEAGQRRPILIVAASAPMTLEPAAYAITVRE